MAGPMSVSGLPVTSNKAVSTMIKYYLIALLCLWGMTADAAPKAPPPPSTAENPAAPAKAPAAGSKQQTIDAAKDQQVVKPTATVKNKAEAFKYFIPSETISADNAVSFPADI